MNGGGLYVWENYVLKENLCRKCGGKHQLDQYRKTGGKLRSFFVSENMLDLYYLDMKKDWGFDNRDFLEDVKTRIEIQQSVNKIHDKIKEFESTVYFGGLRDIVKKSTISGVSAHAPEFNDFKVLTFCSAGRTLFTFDDKESSVTAICAEDSETPTMGMQGVDATEFHALRLINLAIRLWQDGDLKFKADKKIGF